MTRATAKPEKAAYEPFGEVLSTEVAFLQAAALLDVAADIAIDCKDTERMQSLSLSWMELGKLLMGSGPCDEDEDEDEEGEAPIIVGFTGKERTGNE